MLAQSVARNKGRRRAAEQPPSLAFAFPFSRMLHPRFVMDPLLLQRAHHWIANDVDEADRAELSAVIARADASDLADRMAGPLEFGTAGLRGVLGAGPNRMNRAVVIRTTAGLAAYLLEQHPDAAKRGIVVGYDARRMSREFAVETACVLAAAGIVAHLFPERCSTPQTAFATTYLGAAAGVMVTASHNPPEYNGYKVYWGNGAQIIPPHDKGIATHIDAVAGARDVPRLGLDQARSKGLVRDVGSTVTDDYLSRVAALSLHSEGREGMRIVYTPLHGMGFPTASAALRNAGFSLIDPVPEQVEPDGAFPTVRFPNPEEEGALDLAFQLARQKNADLIIANDPDADRLSVAVPRPDGAFQQLTGNQVGVLLAHYVLAEHPNPPRNRLVVTTIVSSPMLGVIAADLGVRYVETLTGFKWIANRAMQVEAESGAVFAAGYEEALGYTIGTVVRDKDGVSAAAIFAELAAWYRLQGRSIHDQLELLYRKYGLFLSRQASLWHRGVDGADQINAMMARLRANPPSLIGGLRVQALRDYKAGIRRASDGTTSPIDLPSSNVLAFDLEGGNRAVARPSGTEPKIKFYFDVREPVAPHEPLDAASRRAEQRLDSLQKAMISPHG